MEFHFRRHFRLRPNGLYIKLFQITPYVNDFRTLNTLAILHHHRRRRVVRVNRCAALWPLAISALHSVDSCCRTLGSS